LTNIGIRPIKIILCQNMISNYITREGDELIMSYCECRRFNGHRRTIRPNVKKLNNLFPLFDTMPWENFAAQVQEIQKGYMGDPMEVNIFCL
jgi:hypothetical protein